MLYHIGSGSYGLHPTAGQLPASDPVAFTTDTAARQNVVIIVETPTEIIIIIL